MEWDKDERVGKMVFLVAFIEPSGWIEYVGVGSPELRICVHGDHTVCKSTADVSYHQKYMEENRRATCCHLECRSWYYFGGPARYCYGLPVCVKYDVELSGVKVVNGAHLKFSGTGGIKRRVSVRGLMCQELLTCMRWMYLPLMTARMYLSSFIWSNESFDSFPITSRISWRKRTRTWGFSERKYVMKVRAVAVWGAFSLAL